MEEQEYNSEIDAAFVDRFLVRVWKTGGPTKIYTILKTNQDMMRLVARHAGTQEEQAIKRAVMSYKIEEEEREAARQVSV